VGNAFEIIGSIVLALVPALIWGALFYHKHPKQRSLVLITFLLGALAVFPILIYKFLWQFFPWINAFRFAEGYQTDLIGFSNLIVLPLSAIITFMIVGVIEELMKLGSVKLADHKQIRNVDDAIELFIIAALGFSFTENILYFYNIWLANGTSGILLPFLFRSAFSTFAHLIFSGILGYYYGIAHFAKPILQEEIRENRSHWTVILHKIFGFRKIKLFYRESLFEGLLISIGLHAVFNIFLEMKLTFMIVPYVVFGYMALNYLLAKKENHKDYGYLLEGKRNN
jgi:RsiW-degrading membrane proteinase PrsW (M82 family)